MGKKKTEKKWNYGAIVPLIGGMVVANENATGEKPSFLISYEAFGGNDAHCVNRYQEAPYVLLDSETNKIIEDTFDEETGELLYQSPYKKGMFNEVDFVSAVCPCAGLSMLNSNNNGSGKARGADAVQNDWMYKSARFVLETVQPKVFWGENAPGLYTKMGEKVVENLRAIGEEFGYSFSMIKTDTYLHGIPQHRTRTFYFFWKDSEAPLLNYHKTQAPMLEEYLNQVPEDASEMDRPFGMGEIKDNGWFQYAKHKGWSVKRLVESEYKTMFHWVGGEGLMDDAAEWAEENDHPVMVKFINHTKKKLAENKGWWDGTPLIFHDATNAIIAKNAAIVHPGKDRGITIREAMHLMGLPHDFELVGGSFNHICQNVPVKTATDWTTEVMRFVKGEIKEFGGNFVKQSNINQRIDHAEKLVSAKQLF
jgi:site-specific DNA-cytosine methylase